MVNPMKRCSKCKVEKELSSFHKDKVTKDGVGNWCKECWIDFGKKRRKLHICPHCNNEFFAKNGQIYCSLKCALWSRILVLGITDCWEWQGSKSISGYGFFSFDNKRKSSTREVVKELGDDPTGLYVCHKCDNPGCCNPEHLFLGTAKDNSIDMHTKGRNNTPKGEQHFKAILTDDEVLEIKSLLGKVRQVDLAYKFRVKRHVIADISAGRSWVDVN